MSPPKFKWPKAGNKAFGTIASPIRPPQLAAFVERSDAVYTLGFRLAADAVIEYARQENTQPDLIFIPAAYLYRHYLELMLKDLVRLGVRVGMLDLTDERLTKHNLLKLWSSTKKLIKAYWPTSPPDDMKAAEQVVFEFHRLDKNGQAFRYANDLEGNASLPTVPEWIDLDALQSTMNGVANFLEACEAGIDAADPGPP
jgi:hypothetical protein